MSPDQSRHPAVSLAVTVVGHDRPGIIAQAAHALAELGMNLEDSSMTRLRNHFTMTLVCAGTAPAGRVSDAFSGLRAEGLGVTVREVPAEEELPPAGPAYLLSVHGADRLGIVARLAGVVADHGGNITDLTTRISGELYVLVAEVDLASAEVAETLRRPLEAAADELGVQVSLRPLDRDEL